MPKDYEWMLEAREKMYQNKLIVDLVQEFFSVENEMSTKDFINILDGIERR